MKNVDLKPEDIERIARQYGEGLPGLQDDLKKRFQARSSDAPTAFIPEVPGRRKPKKKGILKRMVMPTVSGQPDMLVGERVARVASPLTIDFDGELDQFQQERIVAATIGGRPVARIKNNKSTTEFLGIGGSDAWIDAIRSASNFLNDAIPKVGRIELINSPIPWVGTGWIIKDGILVTNAHVASEFVMADPAKRSAFVFKPGLMRGQVSSKIDFLEEGTRNRNDSLEHPITEILWISPDKEVDVAFFRVERAGRKPMPGPIKLAEQLTLKAVIAAIGYPARDSSIRDQQLVISIFGNDVYDKKRLSPGFLNGFDNHLLRHDCSTLGGNSGSLLIDFKSGEAIGLHMGGLLNDSTNFGITSTHLIKLLKHADSKFSMKTKEEHSESTPPVPSAPTAGDLTITFHIPVQVTVKLGTPIAVTGNLVASVANTGAPSTIDAAVAAAKEQVKGNHVLQIRKGYRFRNGWITDERVVVVEVAEKLSREALAAKGIEALPESILGYGIDVRTAGIGQQLERLGMGIAFEAPAWEAKYEEPDGFKDSQSDVYLGRVKEKMSAIFHVSPDAGFSNLKAFLDKTKKKLTIAMYEWDADHISDALEDAVEGNKSIKMVAQKRGVRNRVASEAAVLDMETRLGKKKFKYIWASVGSKAMAIPNSYHIKVASRDGEAFWLSSGNWKDSGQQKEVNLPGDLTKHNREWNVVLENKKLATLFQKYIEHDFELAEKYPLVVPEGVDSFEDTEFLLPIPTGYQKESVRIPTYEPELKIEGEVLDIQPLLTPDHDEHGERIFIKHATDMIMRAKEKVYIQNQSFKLTASNSPEFDKFFEAIKAKQQDGLDVRIIFRDSSDYPGDDGSGQEKLLELLKDFGLDVSSNGLRIQPKCHTKGIIIDSKEVLLGSQNLTNLGALTNRDASLLVRTPKVAKFFEKIFLYDWENLAHNDATSHLEGMRRREGNEPVPEGFRVVKLSELLED